MLVFALRTLIAAWAKHPDAEQPLRAWYAESKKAEWSSWPEVQSHYSTADRVGDRIVFNIKGNNYRLIVAFDFVRHTFFIKWFGTHAEYDKINVATVEFSE